MKTFNDLKVGDEVYYCIKVQPKISLWDDNTSSLDNNPILVTDTFVVDRIERHKFVSTFRLINKTSNILSKEYIYHLYIPTPDMKREHNGSFFIKVDENTITYFKMYELSITLFANNRWYRRTAKKGLKNILHENI